MVNSSRGKRFFLVGVAWAALPVLVLGGARRAAAADTTVPAGGSLVLPADLVLTGADSLIAGAASGGRCQINGQTHSIRTDTTWTGTIRILNCDLSNLGPADQTSVGHMGTPAIAATAATGAVFDVEGSTFDTSGQIYVGAFGDMTIVFRGNTINSTSVAVVDKSSLDNSQPAFLADGGGGPSQKLFQGNKVLRSWVCLQHASNWLIGGSTPAEENILVGTRGGLEVHGNDITIQGNYISPTGVLAGWNQLAALNAESDADTMVVEHNVIRGGNWLIRSLAGAELRYNLIGDAYTVAWTLVGPDDHTRIHHNVFVRNNKVMEQFVLVKGIGVIGTSTTPSTSIFNNTMDASGYCYDVMGRAVEIGGGSFLQSLRNNVIYDFPSDSGSIRTDGGMFENTALVGPGEDDSFNTIMKGDPGPAQLGYADYNLFDNPMAAVVDNYGSSVAGKQERVDPGFALDDVTVGGPKDQQVEPMFTGPLPKVFPFSDDDIIAGNVTVCQMLAFYRQIYTPAPGSPLIDKGDPADGAGTDIGAIGAGAADPNDKFGTLCAAADSLLPTPPTVATTCPTPITGGGGASGGGGAGGTTGVTTPAPGFLCICDEASGGPPGWPLALLAMLLGLGAWARPPRAGRRRRGG